MPEPAARVFDVRRTHELQGAEAGGLDLSLIVVAADPGEGPALHRHAYPEIFVVLEGEATFTVGDEELVVGPGQVVVAPPGVPHRFVSSGDGPLRQVDVHASPRFVTEWLEGPRAG